MVLILLMVKGSAGLHGKLGSAGRRSLASSFRMSRAVPCLNPSFFKGGRWDTVNSVSRAEGHSHC